jgi:hypothetical protein
MYVLIFNWQTKSLVAAMDVVNVIKYAPFEVNGYKLSNGFTKNLLKKVCGLFGWKISDTKYACEGDLCVFLNRSNNQVLVSLLGEKPSTHLLEGRVDGEEIERLISRMLVNMGASQEVANPFMRQKMKDADMFARANLFQNIFNYNSNAFYGSLSLRQARKHSLGLGPNGQITPFPDYTLGLGHPNISHQFNGQHGCPNLEHSANVSGVNREYPEYAQHTLRSAQKTENKKNNVKTNNTKENDNDVRTLKLKGKIGKADYTIEIKYVLKEEDSYRRIEGEAALTKTKDIHAYVVAPINATLEGVGEDLLLTITLPYKDSIPITKYSNLEYCVWVEVEQDGDGEVHAELTGIGATLLLELEKYLEPAERLWFWEFFIDHMADGTDVLFDGSQRLLSVTDKVLPSDYLPVEFEVIANDSVYYLYAKRHSTSEYELCDIRELEDSVMKKK